MGEHDVDIMHCNGLGGKMTDRTAIKMAKVLKRYETKKLRIYTRIIKQLGERLKTSDLCVLPEDFSGRVIVFDGENVQTIYKYQNKKSIIVPGGFEPSSPAPKARRIDHYPTGLHRD